jgi:hypothetical protein
VPSAGAISEDPALFWSEAIFANLAQARRSRRCNLAIVQILRRTRIVD